MVLEMVVVRVVWGYQFIHFNSNSIFYYSFPHSKTFWHHFPDAFKVAPDCAGAHTLECKWPTAHYHDLCFF